MAGRIVEAYAKTLPPEDGRLFTEFAGKLKRPTLLELHRLKKHFPALKAHAPEVPNEKFGSVRALIRDRRLHTYLKVSDAINKCIALPSTRARWRALLTRKSIDWRSPDFPSEIVKDAVDWWGSIPFWGPHGQKLFKNLRSPEQILEGLDFVSTMPTPTEGSYKVAWKSDMYESPIALSVKMHGYDAWWNRPPTGRLKLAFLKENGRRIVVVTAIQGYPDEAPKYLGASRNYVGPKWPNYLLEKVEEHAKKCGYDEIRILKPEHNPWFEHAGELGKEKQMRSIYYALAKKFKFQNLKGSVWLVKRIK